MWKDDNKNSSYSSKIHKFKFELTEDTKLALKEFSLNLNKTIKEFSTALGIMVQGIDWNSISKLDLNDVYFNMYATAIEENEELIQLFHDNTIFPPLHYILHNQIETTEIQMSINMWIQSESIKSHYLYRINEWKNKYKNKNVHKIIDEIYYNLNENNYYSVTFLTDTLIEYLLNNCILKRQINEKGYKRLKKIIKQEVFDGINYEGLNEKFIEKNLYCNTDKAEEFSRHTVHGAGLDMINKKNTLTIIFLYDFFQDIFKIREDNSSNEI